MSLRVVICRIEPVSGGFRQGQRRAISPGTCYGTLAPPPRARPGQQGGPPMKAAPDFAGVLRVEVLRILGTTLADEIVLANTTRLYHWNVVGPQFPYLHPFFRAQYQQLSSFIDEVAERV